MLPVRSSHLRLTGGRLNRYCFVEGLHQNQVMQQEDFEHYFWLFPELIYGIRIYFTGWRVQGVQKSEGEVRELADSEGTAVDKGESV
jgi:hypothetical protein